MNHGTLVAYSRQARIQALILHRHSFVIDPQGVQDGGVQIMGQVANTRRKCGGTLLEKRDLILDRIPGS